MHVISLQSSLTVEGACVTAWRPYIRNALIQFVCQDTWTQFVDISDPPSADLFPALLIILCSPRDLSLTVWRPERGQNKVWSLHWQQISCLASPVGGRTVLLEHVNSDSGWISHSGRLFHLKDFLVVSTVDIDSRLEEIDAAWFVPWAHTPTDTIKERWRHANAEITR